MSSEQNQTKKRGRKAKVELGEQLNVYREFVTDLLDENGKIRPASANIYKKLSIQLQMTPKAIQCAVTKNSKQIFGSEFKEAERHYGSASDDDYDFRSLDNSGLTVLINLREIDRYSFDLITVEGPRRNYVTVRPGWPDKLFEILVKETHTECCYSFRRGDVIGSEFKANATCVECEGTIFVISQQNRSKLMVQIVDGEKPHNFQKRRRLAKDKATALIEELKSDTPHNVHIKSINELDDDLSKLPRDFINHKSLENLKYRHNAAENSAITELRKMKYLPQYGSSIKEICCDPFRLIFWTNEQLFYFFKLKKKQRIALSFDATGGLISRASIMQDITKYFDKTPETSHIFLYMLCVKNDNGISVPLGQMLSASQDSVTISFFLSKWLCDFGQPDEIVVDDSKALQKAILSSCTRFRIMDDYLCECFKLLNGEATNPPECFIRLDITHFIANLTKNKVFDKADKRLKHFYLSIFGVLLQCEDFAAIKKIVKDALFLANYPIFGNWNNVELPSGEALKNLNAVIQTHEVVLPENVDTANKLEDIEQSENVSISWFDEIMNEIESNLRVNELLADSKLKSTQTNWYYFPQINKLFRSQLQRLPLWSSVMRIYFNSTYLTGISTDIESRFNVMKNNVFKNQRLPVRADVFLKKTLSEINGIAKLNRLLLPNRDENNNELRTSNNLVSENTDSHENVKTSLESEV